MVVYMSIKERRERDRIQLRNNILDAANALFLELGYEKTTMRKIAERIEYNPATIYFYYKNKEEIFYALQKRAFSAFYEAFHSVRRSESDPSKRLSKIGEAYITFALENPSYYDLMFVMRQPMQALGKEEHWRIGEQNFELLKETVRDCIAVGKLPEHNVDALALMIWSGVHGIVSLYIRDRLTMFDETNKGALVQEAFGLFDGMLRRQALRS